LFDLSVLKVDAVMFTAMIAGRDRVAGCVVVLWRYWRWWMVDGGWVFLVGE
jgi:hypothetical protein